MLLLSPDFTSSSFKFLDSNLRYEQIKHTPPQKIRRWEDSKFHAKGVLIINSLSSGKARGFIKISDSKSLSKATQDARNTSKMIEAEGANSNCGGACAVLICNPNDPNIEIIKTNFKDAVFANLNVNIKNTGEFVINESDSSPASSIFYFAKKIEETVLRLFN